MKTRNPNIELPDRAVCFEFRISDFQFSAAAPFPLFSPVRFLFLVSWLPNSIVRFCFEPSRVLKFGDCFEFRISDFEFPAAGSPAAWRGREDLKQEWGGVFILAFLFLPATRRGPFLRVFVLGIETMTGEMNDEVCY
jgi:hypothetical protein